MTHRIRHSSRAALLCTGLFLLTPGGRLDAIAAGQATGQGRGQTTAKPPAVSAPQQAAEVAQALASARTFRESGLVVEAENVMAAILKKYPADTEATTYQVNVLLQQDRFDDAVKLYDGYVTARKTPDVNVLAMLARADLRRTLRSKADEPATVAQALERLARDGDAESLRALQQASASSPSQTFEDLAPTISLARLKDPAGEARLGEILASASAESKPQVLQAIKDADARSLAPKIVSLLADAEPSVRSAAATALGVLQYKAAVPQLQAAFESDVPAVKMFAAVALKRLGQTSADTFLDGLLNGPIAELRVIAAGAYTSSTTKTPQWDKAVRELMSGPNDQHKIQAAEMLACCDVTAARSLLVSAIGSPNPLLRAGAGKVFEARTSLADATIARRLIGDPLEGVRIYGSGLALALAKAGGRLP